MSKKKDGQKLNLYPLKSTVVKMDRLLTMRPEHCKSALVDNLVATEAKKKKYRTN